MTYGGNKALYGPLLGIRAHGRKAKKTVVVVDDGRSGREGKRSRAQGSTRMRVGRCPTQSNRGVRLLAASASVDYR